MMKLISFSFFIAVMFSFSIAANAQGCGSFGVALNVHDNEINPVTNYTIKITPWLKDDLKGRTFTPVAEKPGTSELKLKDDDNVPGNYRVLVTAPGFVETEKTIAFPRCVRASYDILLLRKKEKYRTVTGHVSDESARSMTYVTVTFVAADGGERSVSTDFIGNYEIKLKPGKYTLKINRTNFLPYENPKIVVPADGRAQVNVTLRAKY